jgi:Glycosyltransferase family 87
LFYFLKESSLLRARFRTIAIKCTQPKILWPLISIVFGIAIFLSIQDLIDFAGIDLRNRVVGARALLMGLDPYHIDWREGAPLELADFWQRYPGVSRVTIDPVTLFLYVPFANLSHRSQQIIWWILQWVAMGGAIAVLFRSFDSMEQSRAFLATAAVCFVGSWFWRLHVERGQYYIFVTLLICLDIAALRKFARPIWLGIPIGVAIALRPPNVILIPLLYAMGERGAAKNAFLAAAVLFSCSLVLVGWSMWDGWLDVVRLWAYMDLDRSFELKHYGPVTDVAPNFIEGLDFSKSLPYYGRRSDIMAVIRQAWAIPLSQAIAIGVFAMSIIVMFWAARRPAMRRGSLLLILSLTPILLDLTRPARESYADVAYLPVIALALAELPGLFVYEAFAVLTLLFYTALLENQIAVYLRELFSVLFVTSLVAHSIRQTYANRISDELRDQENKPNNVNNPIILQKRICTDEYDQRYGRDD